MEPSEFLMTAAAAGTEHVLVVLRTKRKRRMGLQMELRVPLRRAVDCTQIPSPLQGLTPPRRTVIIIL